LINPFFVIPAQAGIQRQESRRKGVDASIGWIPAFAGMTKVL